MRSSQVIRAFFILVILLSITNSPRIVKIADGNASVQILEILKPLNQRLANEYTDFENANIIEEQITKFMSSSNIKGLSLAIVKDEKLIFTNAYGYANIENAETTSPEHLFRIASVSKLVTAITIMTLVEDGKLSLESTVFGKNGIIKEYDPVDPNMNDITVRELLNHSAGWTQWYGDPIFNPIVISQIVNDTLPIGINSYLKFVTSRRLHFKPGTMSSYSNMGYVFLGEVIKRASGENYEDYVKKRVLFPLGIFDMHIGKSFSSGWLDNEVCYYEPEDCDSIVSFDGSDKLVRRSNGGNNIELLGAAGGWIASAPELARLVVAIDGFDNVPDILSKNSITNMTAEINAPLGWKEVDKQGNWIRTGTLAGSSAMIMRRVDGFEWVVLCNSSNWRGPHLTSDIERTMNRIISKVKEWPEKDLFNYVNSENKLSQTSL